MSSLIPNGRANDCVRSGGDVPVLWGCKVEHLAECTSEGGAEEENWREDSAPIHAAIRPVAFQLSGDE